MTETHAVVLGGSIAGLLSARVLSERFDRVTVIERDTEPRGTELRPSASHGRHSHILVSRGRELFERWFPGLDDQLAAAGAVEIEWGSQCLIYASRGRVPRFDAGLRTRHASRATLEATVRQRVVERPNVQVRWGQRSPGPVVERGRAVAARLEDGSRIDADLVVDATGRGSAIERWYADAQLEPPTTTVVDADLAYATRYVRGAALPDGYRGAPSAARAPDIPFAGALWPLEDGRSLVTIAGMAGRVPAPTEEGFRESLRHLACKEIATAVETSTPASKIWGYRQAANRWRRFDRIARHPERLVAVGDAVCSFNPVYGQGMTVAALEVAQLEAALDGGDNDLTRRYYKALPAAIDPAWLLAVTEDSRWPDTVGADHRLSARVTRAYVDRVLSAAASSRAAARAFLEVMHMTRPPAGLARPAVLAATMGGLIRRTESTPPA